MVIDDLKPGYLSETAKAGFHYLDGGKSGMRLRVNLISTVFPQDQALGAMLRAASRYDCSDKDVTAVRKVRFYSHAYRHSQILQVLFLQLSCNIFLYL